MHIAHLSDRCYDSHCEAGEECAIMKEKTQIGSNVMKNTKMCLCLVLAILFVSLAGCDSPAATSGSTPSPSPSGTNTADDTVFSSSEGIDENGFWEGIRALDYVEMFNYKALPIPSEAYQITDDDVQNEINSIMADYATSVQVTDRAVADGDKVNIDYVGSVDGVEFANGSTNGEGADVTIGVTNYIDDFLEQLIGHKPGETFNVEVTFPDVYQEASLQGKDAVFVTTINYIIDSATPELTDEFVAANLSAGRGWSTVSEMREGVRADLQKEAIQKYIEDYLSTKVTVKSVPEVLTKYQERAMLDYYKQGAEYYGMGLEEFLTSSVGVSGVDELIEVNRENNLESATYALAAQAVAEDAGISVSDEDMTNFFLAYEGTSDFSSFEQQFGKPYLKQAVLYQKVVDYIAEHAVLE